MRVASRRVSARQADPPQFLLPQILSRIRIISGKKRKKKIIKIHDTRDVYVCPPNLSRTFFLSPLLTSVPYIRAFFSDCIGRNDSPFIRACLEQFRFFLSFSFASLVFSSFLFLSFDSPSPTESEKPLCRGCAARRQSPNISQRAPAEGTIWLKVYEA